MYTFPFSRVTHSVALATTQCTKPGTNFFFKVKCYDFDHIELPATPTCIGVKHLCAGVCWTPQWRMDVETCGRLKKTKAITINPFKKFLEWVPRRLSSGLIISMSHPAFQTALRPTSFSSLLLNKYLNFHQRWTNGMVKTTVIIQGWKKPQTLADAIFMCFWSFNGEDTPFRVVFLSVVGWEQPLINQSYAWCSDASLYLPLKKRKSWCVLLLPNTHSACTINMNDFSN